MKYIIHIVIIFLILSCEGKTKYKKPENLIPKEQMIDLLYDIHLANGTAGIKNKALESNINYMAFVFKKYKIDSMRFAESNLYYIANINEYQDIFEEVERRLEELKTEYDKQRDSVLKQIREKKKIQKPFESLKIDSVKTIN